MDNEYKTILNFSEKIYIEKKSKFIAAVKPVFSEEEAISFINKRKALYSDATHNVYAYLICQENVFQRYSDDGEPSGTAGIPVLEVIKRLDVKNVVIVVTRYFGGTLLGAAGLIRAYGKSALLAIENATIVKKALCKEAQITIEYSFLGKVQNLCISNGYNIKNIEYAGNVQISVYIPWGNDEGFIKALNEATNANARVELKDKCYITLTQDGTLIL